MLALTAHQQVLSWGTGWQGQLGRIPTAVFDKYTAAKTALQRADGELEELEKRDQGPGARAAEQQAAQGKARDAHRVFQQYHKEMLELQLRPTAINLPSGSRSAPLRKTLAFETA